MPLPPPALARSGELLTPWMNTTLVDFYLNVLLLCCWVFARERSAAAALLWCIFLAGLGSFASWAYVTVVLLRLRPGDPVTKILTG
jgi:hypothetical protein